MEVFVRFFIIENIKYVVEEKHDSEDID